MEAGPLYRLVPMAAARETPFRTQRDARHPKARTQEDEAGGIFSVSACCLRARVGAPRTTFTTLAPDYQQTSQKNEVVWRGLQSPSDAIQFVEL